ncbi:uncharacterized protein V1516DRAFT_691334 [Lipomyces oligophaga]|uniref:uncharacterized protein n=1 Tax=Lipomyces oligophaga TaxID=45792 RepID=UPI0034CF092C
MTAKKKFVEPLPLPQPPQTLLQKLVSVLEAEDPEDAVLNAIAVQKPVPRTSPKRTTRASEHAQEQGPPEPEEIPKISILDKIRLEGYNSHNEEDAIAQLQTDVKEAIGYVLSKLQPTSSLYQRVDKFYMYSQSLFARSATRKGTVADLAMSELELQRQVEAKPFEIHTRGDDKEVLYMVSQHGPLFSSLSKRSRADPREFPVPAVFNTTKIVPNQATTSTARKLGLLSPAAAHSIVGTAPLVAARLRPLLSDFTHPVNVRMPTAKWIRYDAYSSFAPSRDEASVIISGTTVAAVWYDRHMRRLRLRRERERRKRDAERAESEEMTASASPETLDVVMEDAKQQETSKLEPDVETSTEVVQTDNTSADLAPVDPALVQEWLDSDQSNVFNTASLMNVSSLVSRLQELQSKRFESPAPALPVPPPSNVYQNAQQIMQFQMQQNQVQQFYASGGAPPSEEERLLITRVQLALSEAVSQLPPYVFGDTVSGRIPILSNSAPGSLPPDLSAEPGALANQQNTGTSSRRRR